MAPGGAHEAGPPHHGAVTISTARAALGLVALLGLVVVGGCAQTGPTPGRPPAQIVREAVVATAAGGPSHAAVAGQTAVAGQVIPLDGTGVVDPGHQAADLTL